MSEPLHACMHEGVYQGKQVYIGHALILQLGIAGSYKLKGHGHGSESPHTSSVYRSR